MTNFKLASCFLFFCIIIHKVFSETNSTLKFVSVVFRHGDRTPVLPFEMYPKDPNLNYSYDRPGNGELTESGERRASRLGQILCDRYCGILGTDYVTGSIEARSTNFSRTINSLNFLFKSLYPKASLPITVKPLTNDSLLFPLFCNLFGAKYSELEQLPEVRKEVASLDDFKNKLSVWTGKEIKTLVDMCLIFITLEVQKFQGLNLPAWTDDVYPDGDLLRALSLRYKIMNYNNEIKKLNGGMLIRKFIEDMESVRDGIMDKNRKMVLYSAHDITNVAVLSALNVFHPHSPQFSSAVIVELHLIDNAYYVKVLYYLGVPEETNELQIPGCDVLCPLDKFKDLTKEVIPSDFEWHCGKI